MTSLEPYTPFKNTKYIKYHEVDSVGIIDIFDETKPINTFHKSLLQDLDAAISSASANEKLCGIVITSTKKNCFTAGVDIAIFDELTTQESGAQASRQLHSIFEKLSQSNVPTVAAIHGTCLGGGFELALACHERILSTDESTVLGLPEIQLGLIPGGGGSQRLPRLIGIVPSLDLILTGKKVDSKKALKLGIASQVVPVNQLIDRSVKLCLEKNKSTKQSKGTLDFLKHLSPTSVRNTLVNFDVSKTVLESNILGRGVIRKKSMDQILKNTKGRYPAAYKALDAVVNGLELSLEEGLALESKLFGELVVTPESRSLIHIFRIMTAAKKNPYPADIQAQSKEKFISPLLDGSKSVGILGAGLMGAGIATVLADKKIRSTLLDRDATGVSLGLKQVKAYFSEKLKKKRLKKFQFQSKISAITPATSFESLKGSRIIIEAVFEDIKIKTDVLKKAEALGDSSSLIFASNTSSIPITQIAKNAKNPENIVGMHFFSPVTKMPLVEIIRTPKTSAHTSSAVFDLASKMGKNIIIVNDGPGFYTTRILAAMLLEAVLLVSEGNSIEKVDSLLEKFGMPVGPITLIDEVGIDVASHIVEVLANAFPNRMTKPEFLEKVVSDNRKGRKNGKGFYTYEDGKKTSPDESVYLLCRQTDKKLVPSTDEDITTRTVYAFLNEAARCLDENIIQSEDDGDLGAVFGLGFPPFLGGPFWHAKTLSPSKIAETFKDLETRFGKRFAAADYWKR